jgi:hypothetical protein
MATSVDTTLTAPVTTDASREALEDAPVAWNSWGA